MMFDAATFLTGLFRPTDAGEAAGLPVPASDRTADPLADAWRRLQAGLPVEQLQGEVHQWRKLAGELTAARLDLGESPDRARAGAVRDVLAMQERVAGFIKQSDRYMEN